MTEEDARRELAAIVNRDTIRRSNPYTQSATAEEEAIKATGISDMGIGQKALVGVGKSFIDTSTAAKQLVAYATSDQERLQQLKKEQDEANQMMQYTGIPGMLGQITGSIAQGAIPGVGVNALLGKTVLTSGITGAAVAGAGGGLIQPLGTKDTVLGNITQGALLGAGLGTALKAGGAIVNRITTNPAKREASRIINDDLATLNDVQKQNYMALIGTIEKDLKSATPSKSQPTLGETFAISGSPSSLQNQLKNITSERQYNRFANQEASKTAEDVKVIGDIIKSYTSAGDAATVLGAKSIIKARAFRLKQQIEEVNKPLYDKLDPIPAIPEDNIRILTSKPALEMLRDLSKNPEMYKPTALKIQSLLKVGPQTGKSQKDLAGIDPMTLGDWNHVYKNISLIPNKDNQRFMRDHLQNNISNPEFKEAISSYADIMQPLNQLRSSDIFKSFEKNPDRVLFKPGDDSAKQLGQHLERTDPALLQDLSLDKLLSLVNKYGTPDWNPKQALAQIQHIQALNSNNPAIERISSLFKQEVGRQRPNFTKGVVDKKTGIEIGVGLRGPYASIDPRILFNRLKSERNQQKLVDILSNPDQYIPLIMQATTPSKLGDLIERLINTTAFGVGQQ